MNNKILISKKISTDKWWEVAELQIEPELLAILKSHNNVAYTLADLLDIQRLERIKFAKEIKEKSVNVKLDMILAAVQNKEYIPECISTTDTVVYEYPWSDADELGIKDKWDDHFFACLSALDELTELIGYLRYVQHTNNFISLNDIKVNII